MMTKPPKNELSDSSLVLTQLDVDRLLADPSADSRMNVLNRVSHHYNDEDFGPREHKVAEQIFRLLMKDVALVVRETLAENLKNNPEVPRDIVLHIVQDVESVASPILQHSLVLSDADLVSIIEANRDLKKLFAITRRSSLSSRVSEALAEVQHPDIIHELMRNPKADISTQTYKKIVDEFPHDNNIMQSIADRTKVPMPIIERMVHEASAAIAVQLKSKYNLPDTEAKRDAAEAHDDVLLRLLTTRVSAEEMQLLVAQMHKDHRLSVTLIMKGLCRGQLNFFTASLAHLAGVSVDNAMRLLGDQGDLGFRGLYQKAALPESMLRASYLVYQSARDLAESEVLPGSRMYADQLAEQVLQEVGGDNILHLPHFIALIRQPIPLH